MATTLERVREAFLELSPLERDQLIQEFIEQSGVAPADDEEMLLEARQRSAAVASGTMKTLDAYESMAAIQRRHETK